METVPGGFFCRLSLGCVTPSQVQIVSKMFSKFRNGIRILPASR